MEKYQAAGRLVLFKQKRSFKTKKNDHVASRWETTITPVSSRFIRHV